MSRYLFLLALVSQLNGQSTSFEWIQQLGGSQGQTVAGLASDSQGNVYVAGNTTSTDFPTRSAIQSHPGGSGMFRSDLSGAYWQNLYSSGLASAEWISSDPRNPDTIYATGNQGVFRSKDAGATWAALGGLPVRVHSITVDPAASDVLYAGTYGNGIYKSTDAGLTWAAINNGIPGTADGQLDVAHVWIDPRSSVILARAFTGLARSTDGGATWQTNVHYSGTYLVTDLAFDPRTPGVVYLGTLSSFEKSADDGLTWVSPIQDASAFSGPSILVDPTRANTVYACGISGGLFQSTDGGNTWTNKYQFSNAVCRLASDPSSGQLYFGFGPKVFMSTDGFTANSPVGPAVSGVTALTTAAGHLFVGSQISTDVYVTKFDPKGNIVYSTYIGGASDDEASALAVDASGSVYLTGTTYSTDFSSTPGAYAPITWGGNFVVKLNPDGTLAYATGFTGGNSNAIAVDGAGRAYIAGITYGGLPVTSSAYHTEFKTNPASDTGFGPESYPPFNAFLAQFDAAGARLIFSTYIGTQNESAAALALSPDGNVLLGGGAKVYRMSADGSALLGSATLPGIIWTVAADSAGSIYAGGQTDIAAFAGSAPPFPTTPGAFQTSPPLGTDFGGHAFITRFDSQFHVLASTLLAGEASDVTLSLNPDTDGNILAGGSTYSKAFPTRGPAQGSFAPATGWVAKLTPDLSALQWATFAGDTRSFTVRNVISTSGGGGSSMFFAGATENPPFYSDCCGFSGLYPSGTSLQSFVVKIAVSPATPRIDAVVNAATQLGFALSPGVVFEVRGEGFAGGATLQVNGLLIPVQSQSPNVLTAMLPSDFVVTGAATITVQAGGHLSNAFLAAVVAAAPGS